MYTNNPFDKEIIKTIDTASLDRAKAILEYKQSTLSLVDKTDTRDTALFGLDNYITYNNGVSRNV